MKVSDYLAQRLLQEGIKHVFQVIGGASVHMVHSLAETKGIEYVCVQHEQAGAMAAECYSRVTNNIGAAMATSGPGMTNLITGIACAYFDSIPVIYITGQVNVDESKQGRKVRQVGFQETEIVDVVEKLTKYAVRVENPEDIRYYFEKLIYIARSGRPGPVLLDMPNNVQRAEINPKTLRGFPISEVNIDVDPLSDVQKNIVKTLKLLEKAQRPVLIAGGGIRYANMLVQFEKLVDMLGIPVVATWSGIDSLYHSHPLYRGQIGVYGNRGANFIVQNSDYILSLGSRLDTRITGGKPETFARNAQIIAVDIDRNELFKKRGLNPTIGICADVRIVIPQIIKEVKKTNKNKHQPWIELTDNWRKEYPAVLPKWRKRKNKVDPYVFIETLSQELGEDEIIITDCGANLTWTIQAFQIKKGQRLISAMGNSPMGYSFPAAIGAALALKKPVTCIIGDGGLQMNIQELQTLFHYKIPIRIFILNNHSYGIIMQFQEFYFDGKFEATLPSKGYSMPDFIQVAQAYNLSTETINNHLELRKKIRSVLRHKGPIICDVDIPVHAKLIPKLEFGKPIEDMSPFLSDTEFKKHMIVPVISRS